MTKLSLEERALMHDFSTTGYYKVFLKDCEATLELLQRDLVNYDMITGGQEKLVHLKLKADGAQAFILAMKRRMEQYRAQKPNDESE